MGFRKDAYAKVWEVTPKSDTMTKLRISISRKNKQTDEYEQEFGDYVACIGTAVAAKAAKLKEGDRIKLGDVDVTSRYDKEKKKTYINFKIFSFETEDSFNSGSSAENSIESRVDSVDDGDLDDRLPF